MRYVVTEAAVNTVQAMPTATALATAQTSFTITPAAGAVRPNTKNKSIKQSRHITEMLTSCFITHC